MHINNRSPSPAAMQQAQTASAGNTTASSTAGSATSAMPNLKNQLTPRSEDYLLRLKHHGTLTEKAMASAASTALENDRFLANPAREKPISQFGITMTLEGGKGVLLANFTPHNDKLELEALAFREERFFEAEAGKIETVVLDRARELPEIKPDHSSAGAHSGLQLKQTGGGDAEAEAKALDKDIKRFQNQTMHRQMASKLANTHVAEGRYNSRLTALPVAHATVFGARVKKLVTTPFQQEKNRAVPPQPSKAPAAAIPGGQQYQFSKQEFADFYEEQWLPHREIADNAEQPGAMPSAQASRPGSAASVADASADTQPDVSSRRRGQFFSQEMQSQLQQQIGSGSSGSSTADNGPGSPHSDAQASYSGAAASAAGAPADTQPDVSSRRRGQFFSQEMQSQLQQQLKSGSSASSLADNGSRSRRFGGDFNEQFINQLKNQLDNLPPGHKE